MSDNDPVAPLPRIRIAFRSEDTEGPFGHTFEFLGDELVAMEPLPDASADILINGDGTLEIGDWRGTPLGCGSEIRKDLEGWEVPEMPPVRLSVGFGTTVAMAWSLVGRGSSIWVGATETDPAMTVGLSYADALDWLWGDLKLGQLMWSEGIPIAGNVFMLSGIVGFVSSTTLDGPPKERLELLRGLAQLFDSGAIDSVAGLFACPVAVSD
jgi:hypothetical protein